METEEAVKEMLIAIVAVLTVVVTLTYLGVIF